MPRGVASPGPESLRELLESAAARVMGLDADEAAYNACRDELCKLVHALLVYGARTEAVEVLEELDDYMRREHYRRKHLDSARNKGV